MSFFSVSTYNFRNLQNSVINTDSKNIFLIGENGQGKTNFLEAVYLLCFGNSFRTKTDSLLLMQDADAKEMSVKGIYNSGETEIKNSVFLTLANGKKTIFLNNKKIADRKEIIYNIPCVVFSHDDISFVNGSPERRRLFFNQTISLYDVNFLDTLRAYNKVLKSRNMLLKNGSCELLSVLNTQLAQKGIDIIKIREKIALEFNETFSPIFSKVSGFDSEIKIIYKPSWGNDPDINNVEKILCSKPEAEAALGTTLTGPHRDRFYFYMNKKDFTKIASTGQTRLISLALKVAQAEFYRKKTQKKPLVLLDDVLLELDLAKKIRFIDAFCEYEQAFFTFLPGEEKIVSDKNGLYYSVDNGIIREK